MNLIDVIKDARIQKHMTQEQVANAINITPKAYSKIETGINELSVSYVKPLCDVLDIPYTNIMTYYCPLFKDDQYSDEILVEVDITNDVKQDKPFFDVDTYLKLHDDRCVMKYVFSKEEYSLLQQLSIYCGIPVNNKKLLEHFVEITNIRRLNYLRKEKHYER